MTPLSKLPIDAVISCEMYPSGIIGARFEFVKIKAHMDADTVRALGIDTVSLHQAVYPSLPSDVANRHDAYKWLKVITQDGKTHYWGAAWIKESSIQITQARQVTFTADIKSEDDIALMLRALAGAGYKATVVGTSDI